MQDVSSRRLVAKHQRSEELPGTSGLRKTGILLLSPVGSEDPNGFRALWTLGTAYHR